MSDSNDPMCVNCGKRHGGEWCLNASTEMQPTFVSVDQEVLRAAEHALDVSQEHVRSVLVDHDANLGRTTIKNKMWAEQIESHIRLIDAARASVREALGWLNP